MPGARLKRMRLRTVGSWNDFRTDRTGLADPHVGRGSRRVARTLILGGGFGGLAVAHELRRLAGDEHEIVLVDRGAGYRHPPVVAGSDLQGRYGWVRSTGRRWRRGSVRRRADLTAVSGEFKGFIHQGTKLVGKHEHHPHKSVEARKGVRGATGETWHGRFLGARKEVLGAYFERHTLPSSRSATPDVGALSPCAELEKWREQNASAVLGD